MKKPSEIKRVKAKVNKFLCPRGFDAITLFGIVYLATNRYLRYFNSEYGIMSSLENHEMIHIRQAYSTKDSWIVFYLLYIWYWIKNLPLLIVNKFAPYKFNPFEIEAYEHEADFYYNDETKAEGWKIYTKLTLKEKFNFSKEFYGNNNISFGKFIRDNIRPTIKG